METENTPTSSKQKVKMIFMSDHHGDRLSGFEGGGTNNGGSLDESMKKKKGGHGGGGGSSSGIRCCQAEKCMIDLAEAKQYHRRHRVCELHAKAQAVIISGVHQRFCQQCSRFHELSEFDDAKRSCRRRLAGHNERRRKSSSEFKGIRKEFVYGEVENKGRFQDGCERERDI